MGARVAAAKVVAGVLARNERLDDLLPEAVRGLPDPRDRSLAREIGFGTLRWYFRLDAWAANLVHRGHDALDPVVRALILCGLYQLSFLRVPQHAAVSETVEAARALKHARAAGLINAVLRGFLRRSQELDRLAAEIPSAHYAHPDWFIECCRREWPDCWERVLAANNERPPLHLRVNLRESTREACRERLAAGGHATTASPLVDTGICVEEATDVEHLPGFSEGRFSVQDFGAQLAAPLLGARAGERVLDACAAPGGKTSHILEQTPGLAGLVAVDHSQARLERVRANLDRLHLGADLVCADASRPEHWWDGEPFHRVLLDVPCSATGVVRRHPDIKVLRKPEQLTARHEVQCALLEALWPVLVPGGHLLYSTCSVLRSENDGQIEKFAGNHKDVEVLAMKVPWGVATQFGRQTLPGVDDADGFFYALLEKK